MNAVVIYESIYGNTRAVAEAIADGLGGAETAPVPQAGERIEDADLIVVGGPTHMHGLTTSRSRRMAADAAREDGRTGLAAGASAERGLRHWLRDLPGRDGAWAAAFDTRLDRSPMLTGAAARGIARRLRHHGYEVVATESFLVEDSEGPLQDGELERARNWGTELARRLERGPDAESGPTGVRARPSSERGPDAQSGSAG